MKQLPAGWRRRLLKEEAKQAARQIVVKVTGCTVGATQLKAVMEHLEVNVLNVRTLAGCMHMRLGGSDDLTKVLGMRDLHIAGQRVSMLQVRERGGRQHKYSGG